MRLIDADALAERLGITDMDCYKCAWGNHGFCGRDGDFPDACEAIEDAPTIDAISTDDVAEMLAEQFNDRCPCNYNSNDEWLPYVCELTDECPNPKDPLGCWKQFIKHYGRRPQCD